MVNRRLIRPNLAEIKERLSHKTGHDGPQQREQGQPPQGGGGPRRRFAPSDSTSAEAFYYLKQMNHQTPMVVVLDDGEQLRGHIEWYDRSCLKVHREGAPNLLVYKHSIRYMYKQEEEVELPEPAKKKATRRVSRKSAT